MKKIFAVTYAAYMIFAGARLLDIPMPSPSVVAARVTHAFTLASVPATSPAKTNR